MGAKIEAWLKNVIGELISSKKSLAAIALISFALMCLRFKVAVTVFVVWMICQTAVDITRIIKGTKS